MEITSIGDDDSSQANVLVFGIRIERLKLECFGLKPDLVMLVLGVVELGEEVTVVKEERARGTVTLGPISVDHKGEAVSDRHG